MRAHRTVMFLTKGFLGLIVLMLFYISAALNAAENLTHHDGMWRGELHIQDGVVLAIGIIISENNTKLTLNSPNQGMFDYVPTSFDISHNSIRFQDEGLKASFKGSRENESISGVFTQGEARPLVLHKLDDSDIARMQFEGKYGGDLVINTSSQLPLVVHVAVIKNGFSGVLDSPAQNSFGIPLSNLKIDDAKLTFSSKMLKATFAGEKNSDGYKGTFVQGMPLPLTLSKVTKTNAHMQFTKPEFGEQGGSIAVISPNQVSRKYFGKHTAQTLYEIGSVSKTFSAYLLAKQVASKQITMSSSLDQIFAGVVATSLKELATHTSGLKRNPLSVIQSRDSSAPFANISLSVLRNDLTHTQLGDKKYLYSNFAYAALGEALASNVNSTFSDEIRNNIFTPLNMGQSYVAVDSETDNANIAQGHTAAGGTARPWHFGAASGAGAIVASLDDMVKYSQHMLALQQLNPNIASLLFTSYTNIGECCEQGLAWILMNDEQGKKYAWHNGMTGGFSTFLGFYLDGSKAVVLLNNQATNIDKLGHKILTENALDIRNI